MLSIFPFFLSYQELSPFLIRLVLGITLAYFGYRKIKERKQNSGSSDVFYGAVKILISIFLIIGLYTQLAALIVAIILIIKLAFKAVNKQLLTDGVNYYILLLVIAISLVFTGAGWFAFDLPL